LDKEQVFGVVDLIYGKLSQFEDFLIFFPQRNWIKKRVQERLGFPTFC
jgi:hypothetical protein